MTIYVLAFSKHIENTVCLEKIRTRIKKGEVPLSKDNQKEQSRRWVIPVCILLILLVFVSGIILGTRIGKFTDVEPYTEVVITDDPSKDEEKKNKDKNNEEQFVPEPGMAIGGQHSDGSVKTDLSIFCATYENENKEITVRSLGGDKVVAPGTTNSHVIRITNTGNCALDYELNVKDLFPNVAEDRVVPIEIRMMNYKGKYVIGSKDKWISLEDLDITCESGTVGKSCYIYYTLEWRWPYETDTNGDIYDTLLGTLSNTEKIECGITITTTAIMNENPDAEGGFWVPKTGDYTNSILWISLTGVSLLLLFILLFERTKKSNAEE